MSRSGFREVGPHPAVRALTGLVAGLLAGAAAALVLPRERDRDGEAAAHATPAAGRGPQGEVVAPDVAGAARGQHGG